MINKRKNIHNITSENGVIVSKASYILTFELYNGGKITLKVSKQEYKTVEEYTYGTLTYKGKHFISFKK